MYRLSINPVVYDEGHFLYCMLIYSKEITLQQITKMYCA